MERRRFGREIRELKQQMASGQGDPARQQQRLEFLQGQQQRQAVQNAMRPPPQQGGGQWSNNVAGSVGGEPPGKPIGNNLNYSQPMPRPSLQGQPGMQPPYGMTNAPQNQGLYGNPDGTYSNGALNQNFQGSGGFQQRAGNGMQGMDASGPVGQAWGFHAPYPRYPGLPPQGMPMQPMPRPALSGQPPMPGQALQPPQNQGQFPGLRRPQSPQGLLSQPPRMPNRYAPDDRMTGGFQKY